MAGDPQKRQEELLIKRGEKEGKYKDLIILYFTQRRMHALADLEKKIEPQTADRVYLDLAFVMERPESAPALLDRAIEARDPWVFYSLTKFFLKNNRLEDALRAVARSIQSDRTDVFSANLLIKYLTRTGHDALAARLMDSSLALCPQQEDIVRLRETPYPHDLYLDVPNQFLSVDFYLPVYNVERYIRSALEGVFRQNYPLHEVLVINDGTPDASMAIAREYPVRILEHDVNRGLAAARNTAFRHATGHLIGAIDTDARPDPDYMRNVMIEFENAGPDLAGVGGRLVETHTDTPPDHWRSLAMPQQRGGRRICPVEFLYGSNCVFRRDAVLAVGGYDERFRTNAEDTHVCAALRASGFHLVYTPCAVAYHERTDSIPSVLKTMWNWFHASKMEQNVYRQQERLLEMLYATLDNGIRTLHALNTADMRDVLYVQFAYVLHEILMDVQFACQQGICSNETAAYVQNRILNSVDGLDRRLGGRLGERLRKDIAHAMAGNHQSAAEQSGFELLEDFLCQFDHFCDSIPANLYAALTQ